MKPRKDIHLLIKKAKEDITAAKIYCDEVLNNLAESREEFRKRKLRLVELNKEPARTT